MTIHIDLTSTCHTDDGSISWLKNMIVNIISYMVVVVFIYLSPLMLWVRISTRARCTTLCDKVCQWLVAGRWFSLGTLVSSTNKIDCHDITEILLKVALNTINQPTNKNHDHDGPQQLKVNNSYYTIKL
jgi:hypothetical protein